MTLTRRNDIERNCSADASRKPGRRDDEECRAPTSATLKALEAQHEGPSTTDSWMILAAFAAGSSGSVRGGGTLAAAQAASAEVERCHPQAVRDAAADRPGPPARDRKRSGDAAARIAQVEAQLGNWNASLCLGNDGLMRWRRCGPLAFANDPLLVS